MNAIVLSSETPEATQAYYAARMGTATVEPAAPAAVESPSGSEAPDKPAAEGKGSEQVAAQPPESQVADGDGTTPDPESKVHRRFSELTQQRKDAEAKAAEAERQRVLAEQDARALRAKYEPPPADDLGPEPTLEQFNNATEFAAALKDWTTETVKRDNDRQQKMGSMAAQWAENEAAARAELPDFEAVITAAKDLFVPQKVIDVLMGSAQGPFMLHHLASNPAELSKITGMKSDAQLLYIGKLEGKFEASRASKPAVTAKTPAAPVAASEISRAPAPINPLKGGSPVAESPVDAEGKFHGTYEDYKAARRSGKIQ